MPYSKKAKYTHHRQKPPEMCEDLSIRTVPISHVKHRKKYPKGTKAIVCKSVATGKGITQSILIPKKKVKKY